MRGHRPAQKARPAAPGGFMSGQRPAHEAEPLDVVVDHGGTLLNHTYDGIGDR
jgi:hypothetical protein